MSGLLYPAPQPAAPYSRPRVPPTVPPAGKLYIGAQALDPVVGLGTWQSTAGLTSVGVYNTFSGQMGNWQTALQSMSQQPGMACLTWDIRGSQSTQASVAAGVDDAYITQCANQAAAWGYPMFCRPNWEMNGWWYAWGPYDGNSNPRAGCAPSDYIAAWRHYRSIFASIAPNVSFVWCPHLWIQFLANGNTPPYVPTDMYPGDDVVDWIGMDAYANAAPWDYMQTGQGYGMNFWASFATSHSKPLMISEWALSDGSGDSVTWMNNLTGWMDANPVVRAALYFEFNNGAGHNYLLENLPNSAAAFKSWLAASPSRMITSVPRTG
jgi:beta-mannanase